jgi:hypothetical protein
MPKYMKLLPATALLALLSLSAAAAPAGVYSPAKGVLCDKPSGFCADGTGISASWTEQYLGAEAARKLAQAMGDGKNFDDSVFTLSNRVHCEIKAQVCTRSKLDDSVEPTATKALFGKLPPVARPSQAITFPSKGVICDRTSGFCVDAMGISVAFTEEYLGKAAARKYMDMIRPFKPGEYDPTRYVLSNGVDCDSSKKVCMAERRGTAVERRYTRHLFAQ